MKNLFGINTTSDDDLELTPELKEFVIREVDPELSRKQEEAQEKLEAFEKKWAFPIWLTLVRVISVGIGSLLLVAILRILLEKKAEAFSSVYTWGILIPGILLIAFGFALFFVEKSRKKTVEGSVEYISFLSYVNSLSNSVERDLRVPSSALDIDIFYYPYKEKNGEIKDNPTFKYLNQSLKVFEENGMLCLCDSGYVYGIDFKYLKRIIINQKPVTFAQWNKDEYYDKGEYKDYKITSDKLGVLHIKNTCSLQFTKDGTAYEIIIPPYDIHTIEKLTELKAEAK